MKEYKYIRIEDIKDFKGWEVEQFLPSKDPANYYDMAVISKNEKEPKDEEIERLNNIINKLDKLIEQYSKNDYYYKYNGKYLKSEIINDLKTIRGVDEE